MQPRHGDTRTTRLPQFHLDSNLWNLVGILRGIVHALGFLARSLLIFGFCYHGTHSLAVNLFAIPAVYHADNFTVPSVSVTSVVMVFCIGVMSFGHICRDTLARNNVVVLPVCHRWYHLVGHRSSHSTTPTC